jgi:arylsulfatase A
MVSRLWRASHHQRMNVSWLFVIACIYCAQAVSASGDATQDSAARPNIVILYADDMGWGDTGAYGHPYIKTPSLDRLANEGQRWTDFYVPAPVCSPSRAALLTGRHPVRSGLYGVGSPVLFPDDQYGIPESEVTLAEMLKGAGYRTAIMGKWHLGDAPEYFPTRHGFDYWVGIPYSNDMKFEGRPGIEELFMMQQTGETEALHKILNDFLIAFGPLWRSRCDKDGCEDQLLEQPTFQPSLTTRLTHEATRFIEEAKKEPFFLYLPYTMPHLPVFADEPFQGTSLAGPYGDTIEEIDWSVGQIISALEKAGIDDNTLVFFSSDNGPWQLASIHLAGSTGPFKGSKQEIYEGGVRVPGIFWWPGTIAPQVISDMGSVLDLYRTIAAILELDVLQTLDSHNLTPVLFEGGPSPREELAFYRKGELRAYRKGDFKLHLFDQPQGGKPLEMPELYNLKRDLGEKDNIAEKHPEVVADILSAIATHKANLPLKPPLFDQRFVDMTKRNADSGS